MIDYACYLNNPDAVLQALDDATSPPKLMPEADGGLPGEYVYKVLTRFRFTAYDFTVWIIPAKHTAWCNCEWYAKRPHLCYHIASVLWHTEHGPMAANGTIYAAHRASTTIPMPPDMEAAVALEAEIALSRDIPIRFDILAMSQAEELIEVGFARPNPYPARNGLHWAERLIGRIEDYLYELEFRA